MTARPFWRDASGRLTFSTDFVPRNHFASVCREAAAALGLTPMGNPLNLIEFLNWEHRTDGVKVLFEWDSWMSFMATATSTEAEALVRESGEWLLRNLSPPDKA